MSCGCDILIDNRAQLQTASHSSQSPEFGSNKAPQRFLQVAPKSGHVSAACCYNRFPGDLPLRFCWGARAMPGRNLQNCEEFWWGIDDKWSAVFVQRQESLHHKVNMRSMRFFLSCYEDRTESLRELSLDFGHMDMGEKALRRNKQTCGHSRAQCLRVAIVAGLARPPLCRRAAMRTPTLPPFVEVFVEVPSIEGIEEPTAEQLTCSGSGTLPRVAPVARNNWVVGTAGTAGTAGAEDGEDAHSALDQLRRLMWHPNGLEPLEDLKPAKTQSQRQYVWLRLFTFSVIQTKQVSPWGLLWRKRADQLVRDQGCECGWKRGNCGLAGRVAH